MNLPKVYFPHSKDSPGGFRPVEDTSEALSLTYARLRNAKIHQDLEKAKGLDPLFEGLTIENKGYLEVHPLIVDIPLIFQGDNPLLLSMIPGAGYHYIHSIELTKNCRENTIYLYLNAHFGMYETYKTSAEKTFFIGSILIEHSPPVEKVILRVTPSIAWAIYKSEGRCFFVQRFSQVGITSLQYELLARITIQHALPPINEKAIRATSGGQETEAMLRRLLDETLMNQQLYLNLPFGKKESTTFLISTAWEELKRLSKH